MSTVNSIPSQNPILPTSSATQAKTTSLGQDQFLKLMTAQMTHQDPTKPADNTEFLTQMAQFGTVSGIQDLQKSFKDFSTSISSDQALQATSLVGRNVSLPSFDAYLPATGGVNGEVNLPAHATTMSVKILDPATDKVIHTEIMNDQQQGAVAFAWDGKDANGQQAKTGAVYKVKIEAMIDGINTELKPNIQARVDSVSLANNSQGLKINLAGLGPVDFNKISQISRRSN
jgi:flagellar basal-body rod modification protein FlgD